MKKRQKTEELFNFQLCLAFFRPRILVLVVVTMVMCQLPESVKLPRTGLTMFAAIQAVATCIPSLRYMCIHVHIWILLGHFILALIPCALAQNESWWHEVEPVQWPTSKVIVPAMNLKVYKHVGLQRPRWALEHNLSVYVYQNAKRGHPYHVPKSPLGEENAPYLQFIIQHYSNLPEYTIFVHQDASCHNPAWLQWIDCLQPNVSFVSLSPSFVIQRHSEGGIGYKQFWKIFTGKVNAYFRWLLMHVFDVVYLNLNPCSFTLGMERHAKRACS